MEEKTEVVKKKGDLIQRVNSLLVSLGRGSDDAVKKAFKCSMHISMVLQHGTLVTKLLLVPGIKYIVGF